jgi:hypothetical protein
VSDLDEEILWLATLVRDRYAPGGIPVERVDARTGAVVSDRLILDELGDFLQNVAALTPLLGDPTAAAWSVALVRRTRAPRFRRGGLYEAFAFERRRWRRVRGLGVAFPYWNLDSLCGLVALYEVLVRAGAGDERDADDVADEIRRVGRFLVDRCVRDGHLRYGVHPATGVTVPLSSPQLTGYVAEELIRYGRLAGEAWAVAAATSLLRAECATASFRDRGLFCADVHGWARGPLRWGLARLGKRHFDDPMLVKDNTLVAFALLALETAGGDAEWARRARRRWREAVDREFRADGGYYRTYTGATLTPRLTFNHSVIEWDLEAHATGADPGALGRARRLAERWLALQTERGLVREGPEGEWRRRAFLDPQVDLAMNLLKLGELSGEETWTRAAARILAAIRRDFRLPAGYAWEVDAETGEVRDPVIEVKYLGLLMKGLLGLREVEHGRALRAPLVWMLLRDR